MPKKCELFYWNFQKNQVESDGAVHASSGWNGVESFVHDLVAAPKKSKTKQSGWSKTDDPTMGKPFGLCWTSWVLYKSNKKHKARPYSIDFGWGKSNERHYVTSHETVTKESLPRRQQKFGALWSNSS